MTLGSEQLGYAMKLKPEFKWFQPEEFKVLWRHQIEHTAAPTIREPEPEVIFETFEDQRPSPNMEDKKEEAV
jgi:hypothetical protein